MPRQKSSGQQFADSTRHMPYGKYRYVVEIDGFKVAGFQKVTGLEVKVETRKYRDGGDNTTFHKAPGLAEYSDITLTKGMSENEDFMAWMNEVTNLDDNVKKNFRRSLSIVLQDDDGSEVKRWNVYEAFPVNYKFEDFDAESSDNMLENLTITHEGWEKA